MIRFKSPLQSNRKLGGFIATGGPETSPIARGAADVLDGISMWHLWLSLAWFDLVRKYRRYYIGPFWITLSTAIFIAGIGLVFTFVFAASADRYVPHLTAGVIFWQLISSVMTGGTVAFVSAKSLILQKPLPYSLHVFRQVSTAFLTMLHNIVILIPVWMIYDMLPGLDALWVLPGLLAIFMNAVWVMLVLGVLCARYRDIGQLVPSILQLMFFLTPIMWQPDRLGDFQKYLYLNPFYDFVEIVRGPLLGDGPDPKAWAVVGITTLIGWVVALFVFGQYRRRIPFWL